MPDTTDSNSNNGKTQMAVMATDIKYIKEEITELKHLLSKNYVTKLEFDPVKRLVYGTVTVMGTTVLLAIVALVIRGG